MQGTEQTSSQPTAYTPTDRTVPTRSADRASYDRELVHAILDEGYVCHLGFVRDGAPVVLPTLSAGWASGSTCTARRAPARCAWPARRPGPAGLPHRHPRRRAHPGPLGLPPLHQLPLGGGAPGLAYDVTDPDEKRTALDALVDHVVPGRAADSRPANKKELAATAVIRLDLNEVSAKLRTGGVNDEPEDLALAHWAGVVPLRKGYDVPVADAGLAPGTPVPDYLAAL
ncbi:Flavin-nucleotide-binding protein OS=Streptomyces glaucescens OX=1907 GN=SGLAU_05415 PE=4 SV=1 [Streptomyces glaucescens]